jgi:hypothetical protein
MTTMLRHLGDAGHIVSDRTARLWEGSARE